MRTDLPARAAILLAALALLVVVAVAGVSVGTRAIAPAEIWRAFADYAGSDDHLIIRDVRVPRTILGILVGAALGASGALIQTLTRNPLAEPGILGVTAGAGFAINLGGALGLAGSQSAQLMLAFAGSVLAVLLVYSVGRTSPLRLVLAGVALSSVLAGLSLGMRLMLPDVFDRFRFWSVGALAGREQMSHTIPLLAIGIALLSTWSAEDERAVREAMAAAGVTELAERGVEELSGGQRQRVWVAMVLAQETPYLLLDEPTTFLDITHQYQLLKLFARLRDEGRTVIAVLHDINQACRFADHLVAMKAGRVVAEGAPADIVDAALIEEVFDLPCVVVPDPVTGTPMVVPTA
ncbi:iron chelate uptake ABC transporter family permease subunit [Streptosporangium sp. NBC_01755]|nr:MULTISPECIES: iron chelate uptake ABC transporter family permease subunit [unclassified Streptosporangium]WSA26612.1 iron chelate uptake ABC transporter family permease subunit [Streptosporangium sp. NBC_01810]WSD01964.1 iron chelate uptake ABC transporter family permease subunit [Streptosporangium sp. NBC_01755]